MEQNPEKSCESKCWTDDPYGIEHEVRAMDQARQTIDSIEGQAESSNRVFQELNRVFQERLDEMEVKLFDTGVLKKDETTNEPAISTFVPPNLETRLGTDCTQ